MQLLQQPLDALPHARIRGAVRDLRLDEQLHDEALPFVLRHRPHALTQFEHDRFERHAPPRGTHEAIAADGDLDFTNEYRVMFGRRAVLVADKLVLSARAHGEDMSRGGFFDHFNVRLQNMKPGEKIPRQACGCSSDGFVPGCSHAPDARIRNHGYEFAACSENIHAGSGDPEGAHNGWIHSSGHHRNLLHDAWKEMGTGRVGKFWTQNFGLPVEASTGSDGAGTEPWDRAGGDGNPQDDGGGK